MAEYIDRTIIPYAKLSEFDKGSLVTRDMIERMSTADVVEREKVVKDMKMLYDEIYHLVKTENWNKEREIESKIITQALNVVYGYIKNYTKE